MGKIDKYVGNHPEVGQELPLPEPSDRRIKGSRIAVSFPVLASHKGNLIQGYAEAVNLSWSGMLMATNFPVNKDDEFQLEFTLPYTMCSIQARVRVVRIVNGTVPEEATLIGLAFTEIDPNLRRALAGFVLEHLGETY